MSGNLPDWVKDVINKFVSDNESNEIGEDMRNVMMDDDGYLKLLGMLTSNKESLATYPDILLPNGGLSWQYNMTMTGYVLQGTPRLIPTGKTIDFSWQMTNATSSNTCIFWPTIQDKTTAIYASNGSISDATAKYFTWRYSKTIGTNADYVFNGSSAFMWNSGSANSSLSAGKLRFRLDTKGLLTMWGNDVSAVSVQMTASDISTNLNLYLVIYAVSTINGDVSIFTMIPN